jgi:hypothetical protein
MIAEQNLNSQIIHNEEILQNLRKINTAIEEEKKSSGLVKIVYYQEGQHALEISINPEWFSSPELKSDFHHCVKIAKDGFMELLEKDLQLMKEKSGNGDR